MNLWKNIKYENLAFALLLPLAAGILSSLLTGNVMADFSVLNQPPLSPPGWLFPVVWTILYLLMGVSSYLIAKKNPADNTALVLYTVQLVFNFFWSIWFFQFQWYFFAFLWLCVLWLLIAATIREFAKISANAAWLLLPYLLWVTFAGYLNLAVALLN